MKYFCIKTVECEFVCLYLRRLVLAFASASCPSLHSSANSNLDTFACAIDVRVSLTHNIWLAPHGPRRATDNDFSLVQVCVCVCLREGPRAIINNTMK